jgi:hypothetical protein
MVQAIQGRQGPVWLWTTLNTAFTNEAIPLELPFTFRKPFARDAAATGGLTGMKRQGALNRDV